MLLYTWIFWRNYKILRLSCLSLPLLEDQRFIQCLITCCNTALKYVPRYFRVGPGLLQSLQLMKAISTEHAALHQDDHLLVCCPYLTMRNYASYFCLSWSPTKTISPTHCNINSSSLTWAVSTTSYRSPQPSFHPASLQNEPDNQKRSIISPFYTHCSSYFHCMTKTQVLLWILLIEW